MASNPFYKIESDDGATVRVCETFDLTDPKCLAILYRAGTWPLKKVPGAVEVTRVFLMPASAIDLGIIAP